MSNENELRCVDNNLVFKAINVWSSPVPFMPTVLSVSSTSNLPGVGVGSECVISTRTRQNLNKSHSSFEIDEVCGLCANLIQAHIQRMVDSTNRGGIS